MYTLIQTARLNGVDPQAWLAGVLARINDHRARDLDALLPWNRRQSADDRPVANAARRVLPIPISIPAAQVGSLRIFTSYDDIVDHCCDAWNRLNAQPWMSMSLGLRGGTYRL
jgi:hypothetical protein